MRDWRGSRGAILKAHHTLRKSMLLPLSVRRVTLGRQGEQVFPTLFALNLNTEKTGARWRQTRRLGLSSKTVQLPVLKGISKNEDFFVRARKPRAENHSVYGNT